jgi:hypothetical protein
MINTVSFTAKTTAEFIQNFNFHISELKFKPTLAFSFVSISMDIKIIMDTFKAKNIKVFGASSCGEFLFDETHETVSENAAVFTITDIPTDCFSFNFHERNNLDSKEFGFEIGRKANQSTFPSALLLVSSGLTIDGQKLVEGVVEKYEDDLIMFGGLAGDDSKFEETFVFTEENISTNGALILVLNKNKIAVNGIASSGWIGLGADLKITKSEENIVYTIENKPALDVYKNYLNVRDEDLPAIGLEYPLMIKRDNGESALRAVMGINRDDRSLVFAGSVPENSLVTFSSSPGFDVIKSTTSKITEFYENEPDADLFILFNCMARHLALGPMITQEIKYVTEKWKVPVIGFFTYGEIGQNANTCDFYNQTYTLVKITQKENKIK